MKKIGLLILFLLFVAVSARAETFTETDIGGDTVNGEIRVLLKKTISTVDGSPVTDVLVEVGYATYDGSGNLVRRKTVDITGDLSGAELTKVDTWINTGKNKAKAHANIP